MTTNNSKPRLMTRVSFTVPGKPVGKERPRVTRNGAYTPNKTRAYEAAVRSAFLEASVRAAMSGEGRFDRDRVRYAAVTIAANFPVPVSWSRNVKEHAYNSFCTKKPDADNIAKVICDGLNGVAFTDDACVVSLTVDKFWCGRDEEAGVEVTVELFSES